MRYIFKKVIPVILLLSISFALFLGHRYISKNLGSFLSGFLKENFNMEFSIGRAGIEFPFCLELGDVRINESIDIDNVRIYPQLSSFPSLLRMKGGIASNRIIKARIRTSEIKLNGFDSNYDGYLGKLIKDGKINLESNVQISKNNLIAKCNMKGQLKDNINRPFEMSFVLLHNFKTNTVKIRSIKTNLLGFIFKETS